MRAARLAIAAACALGAAACPGEQNAPVLWLALDGRETEVKLIDFEPPPY